MGRKRTPTQSAERNVATLELPDVTEVDQQVTTADRVVEGSLPVHDDQPGFNQYPIEWFDESGQLLHFNKPQQDNPSRAVRFQVNAEGFAFHGNWRETAWESKTRRGWAIDLWAKCNDKFYTLPKIEYPQFDPRLPGEVTEIDEVTGQETMTRYSGIRELNADICVAVNRWMHFHNGNVETIEDLRTKAEHPIVRLDSFNGLRDVIDRLIKLYVDSARSGGFRTVTLKSDHPGDPPIILQVNLTTQVIRAEFKVPPPPEVPEVVATVPVENNGHVKKGRKPNASIVVHGTLDELESQKNIIQQTPKNKRTREMILTERKIRARIRELKRKS